MPGNEARFTEMMNQGHSAAWDQAWGDAASFYNQALEEVPDNAKALTSLGLALMELQDFEGALRCYSRVAELAPADPIPMEKVASILEQTGDIDRASEVYLRVADTYIKANDADKAIEAWGKATILKPANLLAHSRLAMVYERLGRKPQAVAEYLAVGALMQNSGEVQKAIQAVAHAQQVLPESREAAQAQAMLQAGRLLPMPGKSMKGTTPATQRAAPDQGEKQQQLAAPKLPAEEQLSLDPVGEGRQKALTVLAGMLFEQGDEDQDNLAARRGLASIMRSQGGSQQAQGDHTKILAHLSQAIDLQARGEPVQAIEDLQRAVDAGLDHAAAHFDLGLLLYETNRLESATRTLQRAISNEAFGLASRLVMGQAFRKMGQPADASLNFLEALRLADAQSVPIEQAEELMQLYDPVIETQSQIRDPEMLNRLCGNIADLLLRSNWREQVRTARQQLPAQTIGSPLVPLAEILTQASSGQLVASIAKIHRLAQAGHYRTAMEEAFYALQAAPTYLPLHLYMGDLLLEEDCLQDAVDKYSVVAHSYSVRGEKTRAIEVFHRVIELAPMDFARRVRLIEMLVESGQTDEAMSEYLKLADVSYNQADLVTARKICAKALLLAQQSNVSMEWRVKLLHRMADIDLQSLDWRQGLRVFEQIRALQPDDEKAVATLIDLNSRLGQEAQSLAELDGFITYLVNNKRTDRAIAFVENMVTENPRNPATHRRLAALYRTAGRLPEAVQQLDIAGDILIDTGNVAGATEVVMAILALNPPNAGEYMQLLAQLKAGKVQL